jgi:hypothetical protein
MLYKFVNAFWLKRLSDKKKSNKTTTISKKIYKRAICTKIDRIKCKIRRKDEKRVEIVVRMEYYETTKTIK